MLRYRLARAVANGVLLVLFVRKKRIGLEHVPRSGPLICLPNHVSHLDFLFLLTGLPLLKGRFFSSDTWLRYFLIGPALKWLGAVPVRRGRMDRPAIREATAILRAGGIFGLFPEGTSSPTGLLKGKNGAAYLASRAGAAILPVALVNTERVIANAKRLRRTTVEIRVGPPLVLPKLVGGAKRHQLSALTHLIMVHIAALTQPRYHGHYRDSPALQALLAGQDPWPHCLAAEAEVRARATPGAVPV